MSKPEPFSERFSYKQPKNEILIREDAPANVRYGLIRSALDAGLGPRDLRENVCRVLKKAPSKHNWSEYPNIHDEVKGLLDECEWFKIYDIIENVYANSEYINCFDQKKFANEINGYLEENGIGWQLSNGLIEARGPMFEEEIVREAEEKLSQGHFQTALKELKEAKRDISRRPDPDITGAIQHAGVLLECVMREACRDRKSTMGDLIKKNPDIFPKPLDSAIEKIWGFSSEMGRHLKEGREPKREEAALLVNISAVVAAYLIDKNEFLSPGGGDKLSEVM